MLSQGSVSEAVLTPGDDRASPQAQGATWADICTPQGSWLWEGLQAPPYLVVPAVQPREDTSPSSCSLNADASQACKVQTRSTTGQSQPLKGALVQTHLQVIL